MVHFVGAGPGARDLITLRGLRLIHSADTLMYEGSSVNRELVEEAPVGCRICDASDMTLDKILDTIYETENAGRITVHLCHGDPAHCDSIPAVIKELKARGIRYDVCPGVIALENL